MLQPIKEESMKEEDGLNVKETIIATGEDAPTNMGGWRRKQHVHLAFGLAIYAFAFGLFYQWGDVIRADKRNMEAVETTQNLRMATHQQLFQDAKEMIEKMPQSNKLPPKKPSIATFPPIKHVDEAKRTTPKPQQPRKPVVVVTPEDSKPPNQWTIDQKLKEQKRLADEKEKEKQQKEKQKQKHQEEEKSNEPQDKPKDSPKKKNDKSTSAAETTKPESRIRMSHNITVDTPLFVLSFANHGNVALTRYFRCAGLDSDTFGRTFVDHRKGQYEYIGECMTHNLESPKKENDRKRLGPKAILNGCGDYRVWSEMEFVKHHQHTAVKATRQCFFPALQPKVLDQLFEAYPMSKVLNVVRDPDEWYQTLSPQEKQRWFKWCNANHGFVFPKANAPKEAWINFYKKYQKKLREAVAKHPSVTYIEVDMTIGSGKTASMLQDELGIPPRCWVGTAVKPGLPKEITFPVFVASLPKSATSTSHDYLNCGLGSSEGSHQWTAYADTGKIVTVGECWHDNLRNNRPMLENCGDQKHWSDFGVLRPGDQCFYPTIDGGLEAMYKDHPYATILHTTRDSKKWYLSARKWSNILGRWKRNCNGFPNATETDETAWTDFYDWHTEHVREFAKNHPTMNYVEIKIEDTGKTQKTLNDNFGFSKTCWGHSNINNRKDGKYDKKKQQKNPKHRRL
ncbi:expressed unknown protein [Seminavis robusta]|uniref:Uncharacterized protein n=1 Tax=Seminavis robusta TaxID=568900 RepID=A0A9N8EIG7_9STRA|nr:expressed unknown protein [Seminavis robusta]|eukprot:Sro1008_g230560.1 n/a (680) ;mRNA; r:18891-20930